MTLKSTLLFSLVANIEYKIAKADGLPSLTSWQMSKLTVSNMSTGRQLEKKVLMMVTMIERLREREMERRQI